MFDMVLLVGWVGTNLVFALEKLVLLLLSSPTLLSQERREFWFVLVWLK
jgi:hypothetical protein